MSEPVAQADPAGFLAGLKRGGVDFVTGVPCSSMTGLMNAVLDDTDLEFANAPNEGEALAFAGGARLGGRIAAVLCQNSGLSNLSNALTSLIVPYRIPVLLIVGWRGQPGMKDEPQHRLTGRLTRPFLDACDVTVHIADSDNAAALAESCARGVAAGGPSQAILVPMKLFYDRPAAWRGAHAPLYGLGTIKRDEPVDPPTRLAAIRAIVDTIPEDALVIAPTGLASRALFQVKDSPSHFYMMGSMGHASALGLGVAATTQRPIVVIDGDGSILMRLGSLAFIGAVARGPFLHVVLDNGIHESTGGQASLSARADLCAVAAACGYRLSDDVHTTDALQRAVANGLTAPGPAFIRLSTRTDRSPIPPRITLPAEEIAARFSQALREAPDFAIDKPAASAAK